MARNHQNSDGRSASGYEPLVLLNENRLAHSAATRLLGTGETDCIWLVYLYGPAGVGKSHLVRHFVREARRKTPKRRIVCETTAEFLAALNQAFSRQDRLEFQERYAEADLLILEDLSALQGRLPAQQMLIAILDDLKRAGRRALVTSATRPGGLEKILPRLLNRMRGGLCVPLELLGRASRVDFAKQVASSRQIPLSAEAAGVLAEEGPGTPRELLAAIVNLEVRARDAHSGCDDSLMRAHLKSSQGGREVPLSTIARSVAESFQIPASELRSLGRAKRSILPRQIAMLLARELSGRPSAEIAKFFGRKNHTTVVHACSRTRALLIRDPALDRDVERMRRTLRRA